MKLLPVIRPELTTVPPPLWMATPSKAPVIEAEAALVTAPPTRSTPVGKPTPVAKIVPPFWIVHEPVLAAMASPEFVTVTPGLTTMGFTSGGLVRVIPVFVLVAIVVMAGNSGAPRVQKFRRG